MDAGMGTEDQLAEVVGLMLDFLVSKSLVASERTLRNELQMLVQSSTANCDPPQATAKWKKMVRAHNVYTSELERRLGMTIPLQTSTERPPAPVFDVTPTEAAVSADDDGDSPERIPPPPAATTLKEPLFKRTPVSMDEESKLRQRRGVGTPQQRVMFHDPIEMPASVAETLAHIALPLLYNPHINGLEDQPELSLPVGGVIASRYRVAANIGKGSFSKVYQVGTPPPAGGSCVRAVSRCGQPRARARSLCAQCHDLHTRRMVSVKVLRNDKDCLDAGLGEVRVLALIARQDAHGEQQLLRLLDYFYYKVRGRATGASASRPRAV
jgi:hypothetical protein